jgi:hypothetical protein
LIQAEDANDKEKVSRGWNGRLIKGSMYSFEIPEVIYLVHLMHN